MRTGVNWIAVEKWRDELRSGKHRQGMGRLKSRDGAFCCLGVFSEYVAKIKPEQRNPLAHFAFGKDSMGGPETNWLPKEACGVLGVFSRQPLIFGESFADLNDSGAMEYEPEGGTKTPALSFDEIADLLDIALIEREGIEAEVFRADGVE